MLFPLPQAGWKEYVSLPKLGLGPLVAKLDTGARSAALHADGVRIVGKRVTFTIESDGRTISHTATLHSRKRIKSSNGQSEDRPVIETPILMGGTMFLTEITLTDRTDMDVALLLGRNSLKGRFVVNPAHTFLLSRRRKMSA